jgi:hypothetical protein
LPGSTLEVISVDGKAFEVSAGPKEVSVDWTEKADLLKEETVSIL